MRLTTALLAISLALTATASAEEPAPPPAAPTAASKAEAKKLVKEGTKLYNVQQYDKAAELYQQAYLLDPRPEYLYASAQSQRLHGDCAKALQSYQAYLRTNPAEGERDKAQKNVERCEQDLKDKEAAVQAEQIQTPIDVPAPPPPPPAEPPPPPPPPPPAKSYVLGHILVGVGIAAVGGGVYVFRDGRTAIQEHNSAPTYDEYISGRANIDSAKQKQTIGMAAIGGGAALIAGGVLFYVMRSRSGDEAPPPVSATVTAEQASVSFTGSF